MTAAGRPAGDRLSIGAVLGRLREDFPDVTISKIRFLESEGLVRPARTASGYRQFTESDVERLRFVLAAQRDRYLPLKVIKEQLDAEARPALRPVRAEGLPTAEDFAERPVRMTREELLETAGIDLSVLAVRHRTQTPAGFPCRRRPGGRARRTDRGADARARRVRRHRP